MSRNALPPARRASEAALDALIDPGTSDVSGIGGTPDTVGAPSTGDTPSINGTPGPTATAITAGSSVNPRNSDVEGTLGTRGYSVTPGARDHSYTEENRSAEGIPGTPGTSGTVTTELREHVKVRRALVDQMRDAVWFFSEHGRPRVRLGELLDEAVSAWLDDAKRQHNGGEDFPRKGPLR